MQPTSITNPKEWGFCFLKICQQSETFNLLKKLSQVTQAHPLGFRFQVCLLFSYESKHNPTPAAIQIEQKHLMRLLLEQTIIDTKPRSLYTGSASAPERRKEITFDPSFYVLSSFTIVECMSVVLYFLLLNLKCGDLVLCTFGNLEFNYEWQFGFMFQSFWR